MKPVIPLLMCVCIAACSCNSDSPNIDNPSEEPGEPTRTAVHYASAVSVDGNFTVTEQQQASINSNNDMALQLLQRLAANDESTVFSPLSMSMALAFAADGASGQTRNEIMQVLGLDDSQPYAVATLCATIMQNTLQADTATRFNIANAFYLNSLKNFTMQQDYVDLLHSYYDADIETLDFSAPASLEHINAWGKRQTDGMIPAVLNELKAEAVAYLLNAIYMEGKWMYQFSEHSTNEGAFYTDSNRKRRATDSVKLMHQTKNMQYAETDKYQAVRLPYGNGTFGMTVLLPREGVSLKDMLKNLTATELRSIATTYDYELVDLTLPRFTTDVKTELNGHLQQMGINLAFNQDLATFDGIVNESELYISRIFQKARIEVAELGTKAAAITVIEMRETSCGPSLDPEPIYFTADHPFAYFITERTTGTIYFMGTYNGN